MTISRPLKRVKRIFTCLLEKGPSCSIACVHAKLIQSCPTLCITMYCSLPGSFVHEDSLGKNTGVGCHTFLQGIFLTQRWNLSLLCLCIGKQVHYH